jgi:hypothetical protein
VKALKYLMVGVADDFQGVVYKTLPQGEFKGLKL